MELEAIFFFYFNTEKEKERREWILKRIENPSFPRDFQENCNARRTAGTFAEYHQGKCQCGGTREGEYRGSILNHERKRETERERQPLVFRNRIFTEREKERESIESRGASPWKRFPALVPRGG